MSRICILAATVVLFAGSGYGQDQPEAAAAKQVAPAPAGKLAFNFQNARWEDVLKWLAVEGDFSLQIDALPTGSFSFSDPNRSYTPAEAIDVINFRLKSDGYVLARFGRLLHLIDLQRPNVQDLISELAEVVPASSLEKRGRSEMLTSVFPLGPIPADQAEEELGSLLGISDRLVVLESTRQVRVTAAAETLILIRDTLGTAVDEQTTVVEIRLKNRGAEEVLEIARPLLGLELGENTNDSIKISVAPLGDRMYVTGQKAKVDTLRSLVEITDVPLIDETDESVVIEEPVLRKHPITTADVDTVFDVLQTLLAGTTSQITLDPKTNYLIARTRPSNHDLIAETIAELEGKGGGFKVFELRQIDPAKALVTINKFFGVTGEGGNGPIVDGDPDTGRLWVKGSQQQIETVEALLGELEEDSTLGGLSDRYRILPFDGDATARALRQAQLMWSLGGRTNAIRILPSTGTPEGDGGMQERRLRRDADEDFETLLPANQPRPSFSDEALRWNPGRAIQLIGAPAEGETGQRENANQEPMSPSDQRTIQRRDDIIIQVTPAGLLIASDDVDALDAFEQLYSSIAGDAAYDSDLPTIYWLKYTKADEAAELISKILGGNESSLAGAVDSAVSSIGGGILGGLFGGGGGSESGSAKNILTATGSISIIPDARLNALIVQASPNDLNRIDRILEKLDRAESPETVQTSGKHAMIPVIYQDAEDVAKIVKELLGDRIAGQESGGGNGGRGGGGGGGGAPSPQDFFRALRGGGGGGGDNAKSE
ncbi:MAG: secretin N-terminal domain-containing protein, partial [Planctomycetota bacterium]